MNRRKLLKSAAAIPALTLPLAAQTAAENVALDTVNADSVAKPAKRFLTKPQFAALEKLCEVLVPSTESRPGAKDAEAALFLDFLVSESPLDVQTMYRAGLDRLNLQARTTAKKEFAALNEIEIAPLLKPLTESWKPQTSFLSVVKEDALRATVNSRQFAEASGGRASGTGYYWLPIE